jgi:hypothetical protein
LSGIGSASLVLRPSGDELNNGPLVLLSKSAHSSSAIEVYFLQEGNMDHNESVRKFEHLMLKQAEHAHDTATELEALAWIMPSEKSRQLAHFQVKASQTSQGIS